MPRPAPDGDRDAATVPEVLVPAPRRAPVAAAARSAGAASRPAPGRPGQPTLLDRRAVDVALVALGLCFFEAAADVLPDGPLFWLVTPLRLVILFGLVAMLVVTVRAGAGLCPWRTRLDVPIVGLLLITAGLAVLRGQDLALVRGLLTQVALFYLVVVFRRAAVTSWPAVTLLALTGTATAALAALTQWANQTPTGFCRTGFDALGDAADSCDAAGAAVRVVGTYANPNLLAAFLVLFAPIAIAGVLALSDRTVRVVGVTVVVLVYVALWFTYSRAGVAGGVVGLVAFAVLVRPTRLRLLLAGAGTAVAGLAAVLYVGGHGGLGVRRDVWSAGLALLGENPEGVGLGNAGPLVAARTPGGEEFTHVHNLWLNWFVEAGVLGGLAVLALTALVGWRVVLAARSGSWAATAVGSALAGFGVLTLVDHPANSLVIGLALAIVLGLAETLGRQTADRPGSERASVLPGKRRAL